MPRPTRRRQTIPQPRGLTDISRGSSEATTPGPEVSNHANIMHPGRGARMLRKQPRTMSGIQFLVNESGHKTAVMIDLKSNRNRSVWENLYRAMLAQRRAKEPRETLETVRRRLHVQ